jgi:stearoyl-CoA desaturase (delta-9 desaturase)
MATELPPGRRAARPRMSIPDPRLRPRQQRIALLTILGPTAGLVAALAVALARGLTRLDVAFLLGGVVVGQLCLELGFHRLLAHRAFETHRWLRVLLAVGGSATGQGRVLHWVANHRRHHVTSDTPDDPHSPHVRARDGGRSAEPLGLVRGLVHAQWGHMLTDGVPNCTLFAKDLAADPALRRVNALYGPIVLASLLVPALLGFALTLDGWGALSGFLWGGLVRMFVVQNVTWSVASASHRFGSARFATGDESRNLPWTALPSFGSGWQNNHHAFPHSAFLGMRWWELDVGALALRVLSRLGLVWDLKRPSPAELRAKELVPVRVEPER